MHGSAAANFLRSEDCIIGVGARFDDRTGLLGKYAPKRKIS